MPIPDFVIVGAAKAGTTSLHAYLKQHPRIQLTTPKETFFFSRPEVYTDSITSRAYGGDEHLIRTEADYHACFGVIKEGNVTGEVCVTYLYHLKSAQRIYAANPRAKIFIVVRHPVDRAFSNYMHHVRDGHEPLDFEEAVHRSAERLEHKWWWGFDYIGGSTYAPGVKCYLDLFGQDQVKILCFEDMVGSELSYVNEMVAALGLSPLKEMDASVVKPGASPRRRRAGRILFRLGLRPLADFIDPFYRRCMARLDPGLRKRLFEKYFVRDVTELESILKRDFSHWKTSRRQDSL